MTLPRLAITAQEMAELATLFSRCPHTIIVFGSRVKNTHQQFSDLDICLKADAPLPLTEISHYQRACQESNLPFTVDIIDYHAISKAFQAIVDRDGVLAPWAESSPEANLPSK